MSDKSRGFIRNRSKGRGTIQAPPPFGFYLLLVVVLVVLDLLLRLLADRDLHVAADVVRLRLAVLLTHVIPFTLVFWGFPLLT